MPCPCLPKTSTTWGKQLRLRWLAANHRMAVRPQISELQLRRSDEASGLAELSISTGT